MKGNKINSKHIFKKSTRNQNEKCSSSYASYPLSRNIYIYKNIAHSTIEIFSPMNIAYIITKIISLP